MTDLVLRDNELKQVWLSMLTDSRLGKHEIMKISLLSAIHKLTVLPFRESCSLMPGLVSLYDRKIEYTLTEAADILDGLINPIHHQRAAPGTVAQKPATININVPGAKQPPPRMVGTTPRPIKKAESRLVGERPQLNIEAIVEEAQIEELSSGIEHMRALDIEQQPISIPATAIKQAHEDAISLGAPSSAHSPEKPLALESTEKKQRNYLADVKDAIRKSAQKVKERTRKDREARSVERLRGEQARKKLSSLSGAGTVGLFTPLQLSAKERGSTPGPFVDWEQDIENIINEIQQEKPAVVSPEKKEEISISMIEPEIEEEKIIGIKEPKVPSYTIMTKKIKQRKIDSKQQEILFNEMVQSKHIKSKETFKLGLPGKLGKFVDNTLKETINHKHILDIEDERRREELIKDLEAELPKLPELPPLEEKENIEPFYDMHEIRKESPEKKRESFGELSASFGAEEQDFGYELNQYHILSQMDMKMIQYINEKLKDNREIGFFALIEQESIENQVKCLQELLSLYTKEAINMTQKEPFGDILITQI